MEKKNYTTGRDHTSIFLLLGVFYLYIQKLCIYVHMYTHLYVHIWHLLPLSKDLFINRNLKFLWSPGYQGFLLHLVLSVSAFKNLCQPHDHDDIVL